MKTEIKTELDQCRVMTFPSDEQLCEVAVREVDEFSELLGLIEVLPIEYRADFYNVVNRLVNGVENRQQILTKLHESLVQMSLDLKYLIFDLEATRRERDECLKLVNNWW
ncbi:MAG: hypothetical protein LBH59_09330 [Planctomycetaceae bacterium]|jgi:hypothetical protein|nr:hypothetical protein [Planctomycetaceae bacterium]